MSLNKQTVAEMITATYALFSDAGERVTEWTGTYRGDGGHLTVSWAGYTGDGPVRAVHYVERWGDDGLRIYRLTNPLRINPNDIVTMQFPVITTTTGGTT